MRRGRQGQTGGHRDLNACSGYRRDTHRTTETSKRDIECESENTGVNQKKQVKVMAEARRKYVQ